MYRWSCLSVCVIIMLCLGFCSTLKYDFGENVFHIAVDNTTGHVYVGGDNTVYHLDGNLTIIGNTTLQTTCLSCQNQVRVLEIDYTFRRLLVCGSADHDRCQFLSLANVTETDDLELTTSHLDESQIEGADAQSPIVEYVFYPSFKKLNTSRIVVASSNYESQYKKSVNPDDLSSKPVLSVREIWNYAGIFKMRYVSTDFSSPQFNHMLLRKHNLSYVFDFLDGFCHEEQCFFLTLQQVNASSPELITRIGSVCTRSMFPYVEIPMSDCRPADSKDTGPVFDRALAMSLGQVQTEGKVEPVVILIFGKSQDAASREVDTQHGFAVCKIPLKSLKVHFKQAMMFCGPLLADIAGIPDWFNASGGACETGNLTEPDKVDRCESSGSLVIQGKKGEYRDMGYHAVVPASQTDGKVVSVFTHTQPLFNGSGTLDERMAIFLTTSSGRVHTIFSQWTTSTEVKMTPLRDEPTQASSTLDDQEHSLRKDVAVTLQYYYSLMGTKVVRRPLDYCLEVEKCHLCLNRAGCGWCRQTNTCQLKAKCPGESCLPEIDWFSPKSGPMDGGTKLTVNGTGFSSSNATIEVCQQECVKVLPLDQSAGMILCTVPHANVENATEKSCDVTVTIQRTNHYSLATAAFQYKTPSIRTLQPRRMLREESGYLHIYGDHLDIGTHVEVTVGKDICTFVNRNSDHIRCHLNSPATSEKCFSVDVKIDKARLRLPDDQTLCRCNGPVITGIQPNWTFTGGGVPVTVMGTNLDLVNTIRLGITIKRAGNNTNKTDDRQCAPCANGTCVICCTPNVTNFVTSSSKENVTGDVHFSMRSRENQHVNYTFANDSTIHLVPGPHFWFDGHTGSACLSIPQSSDKLTIMGQNLPAKKWIHVSIGHKDCTVLTSTATSLTCNLQRVRSALTGTNESHPRGAHRSSGNLGNVSNDPETLRTQCRSQQDQYEEQTILTEGAYRLVINIRGRRFFAACVDFSDGSMRPGTLDGSKNISLYGVAGGSGGAVLMVAVIVVCLLYIRHRKKEFQERRYQAQHSSGSGGTLLPSPIGSAENTYVSLAHLLNPQHDKKRKREIHEKKLLIQRKYLTLGNVIGHGNFGCVLEGYLQRRSGVDQQDDMPQKVAVKTLLDPATHAIDLQSFINEALLMKDFEHDHVLGLLGLSEGDRGLPLVILPFMPRGDLLTYVKDEKTALTVGDVLRVCTDIASGMDYLASQKLVHRDLAARNCMLDDDLRVKVADFGLCRDVYEKGYYHSDNKKKLPIRWMSMESIEKGTYSSKSDVWSLGVVMWELTTRGITPYPGVEGWDILRYLLAGRRLDQPLMCPDPLYALMERCWHEQPIERPPFYEIKQTLETLTQSLQTPAAANALCLDTQITIPRCHRFRDDAAVIQKVLMGMHKMSGQGLAASPRTKTSRLSAPLLGGKKSPASTSRKEIKEAESVMTPANSATTKKVPCDALKQEPVHLELMEMKEKKQVKDDGYFVLET